MNFQKNREMMIENQLRPNKITNNKILQAFNKTNKEHFISKDNVNICYSDQDILITENRGYLKNLHMAQIINFADIQEHEKVLHIGGLTGYLSVLISKLCYKIYVTDSRDDLIDDTNKNFRENNIHNAHVFKKTLSEGLIEKQPFDLIIIDCPQYNFNLDLLKQTNVGGRIIYIEKINEQLSRAYRITKFENNHSKDYLFDVFSSFYYTKRKEEFKF